MTSRTRWRALSTLPGTAIRRTFTSTSRGTNFNLQLHRGARVTNMMARRLATLAFVFMTLLVLFSQNSNADMSSVSSRLCDQAREKLRLGDPAEALSLFLRAAEVDESSADAAFNAGALLQPEDKRAEKLLATAVRLDALSPLPRYSLGRLYFSLGKLDEGLTMMTEAALRIPHEISIFQHVGAALLSTYGGGLGSTSARCFATALRLATSSNSTNDVHNSHINQGAALFEVDADGTYRTPIMHYRLAMRAQPWSMLAMDNIGNALIASHRYIEALATFQNLETFARQQGVAMPSNSLVKRPWAALHAAAWTTQKFVHAAAPLSQALQSGTWDVIAGAFETLAIPGLNSKDRGAAAMAASQRVMLNAGISSIASQASLLVPFKAFLALRSLKVVLASTDWRDHPTSDLLQACIEPLRRRGLVIIGLALAHSDGSEVRRSISTLSDIWIEAAPLNDRDAALAANAHSPHVAIDLNGHTAHARLGVFAHGIAPVQCSYLAFPGTVAAPFIPFFISDRVASPVDMAASDFHEKLMFLPAPGMVSSHAAMYASTRRELYDIRQTDKDCDDMPWAAVPGTGAVDRGARKKGNIVLCNFSQLYKLNPVVLRMFTLSTLAIDDASLVLLRPSDARTETNLITQLTSFGLPLDRLRLADTMNKSMFLSHLPKCDVFLDSHPYGAHTVSVDAYWAKVPVVTIPGSGMASRVAAACGFGVHDSYSTIARPSEDYADYIDIVRQCALKRQATRHARCQQPHAVSSQVGNDNGDLVSKDRLFDIDVWSDAMSAGLRMTVDASLSCQQVPNIVVGT